MKDSSVHIIDKVTIDIEVNSSDKAHEMQQRMHSFVNERILPVIEAYFEDLAITDVHVVLDNLNLQFDIDVVNSPFWKEEVILQLDKRFQPIQENIRSVAKNQIADNNPSFQNQKEFIDDTGRVEIRSSSNSNLQAIGYFLSTGKAPWWMNTAAEGLPALLQERKIVTFFEHLEFRTQIAKILRDQPNARKRFIHQFTDSVQMEWVLQMILEGNANTHPKKVLTEALSIFETEFTIAQKAEIWFAIHTYVLEKTLGNSTMKSDTVLEYLAKFIPIEKTKAQQQIAALLTLKDRFPKNEAIQNKAIHRKDLDHVQNISGLFLFVSSLIDPRSGTNGITEALTENLKSQSNAKTGGKTLKTSGKKEGTDPSDAKSDSLQPEKTGSPSKKNASKTESEGTSNNNLTEPTSERNSQLDENSKENAQTDLSSDGSKEALLDAADIDLNGANKAKETSKEDGAEASIDREKQEKQRKQKEGNDLQTNEPTETLASKLESEWNETPQSKLSDFEHIECAGGVLLHPFYIPLFGNLSYLDEDRNLLEPQRAMHLIHYMITGETGAFESQMQFSKFICGLEPAEIIDRSIELTSEEKTQADGVLDSALTHWTALKSNSRELLQNEFLKRPGKISLDGDYLRVMVEKKTVDILLNQLPWNLTMIKLPWFESVIYVEWN